MEKIWAQLTDFSSYGQWNTTHTSFPAALNESPRKLSGLVTRPDRDGQAPRPTRPGGPTRTAR
ncbi:hypothetical protein [Streptomyces silvensis]|uniref:Polyketide cyclase n=1 Tax=Streptomyces silvensis TaxID=1765722 RepID=A0A0W7X2G3_9ACTN|nr:hypothetical protein [Streptomyces silvensis]KUF17046.1 hypothetical protein AT728_24480 [Streptomyces silvensis]